MSVSLHVVLLVLLALATVYVPRQQLRIVAESMLLDEPPPPDALFVATEVSDTFGAEAEAGHQSALAVAPTLSELSHVPAELAAVDVADVRFQEMFEPAAAPSLDDLLVVRGDVGVGVAGASGAIDRITQEILLALEQRPTLVVWLFDQSGSLDAMRKEIYDRFDRVYEQLGALEARGDKRFARHGDEPLLTSVVAFGAEVTFRTPKPTSKVEEVKQALAGIENDPSGVERVFAAIGQTAERYKSYRSRRQNRNVMIVIVTDERGDDPELMEPALALCRRFEMPVYVLGAPAPFGRREALVKYVDPNPNYDQSVQMLPVDQGPESLMLERLNLSFSGSARAQDLEQIDSGFGPFWLTRMCYETGGIFFIVHPAKATEGGRNSRSDTPAMSLHLNYFFDPEAMRPYRPDYVSVARYQELLRVNRAKAALVEAAQFSEIDPMENPRVRFPKQDEASLKQLLDAAQLAAAKLEPKLEALYQILKNGEADREKITEPRWQAGFDLAIGRVLATKVRTEGYNAMLADLKQGRAFSDPKNDTWRLRPADTISVDSRLDRLAQTARQYLQRVVREHPETPWALVAEYELAEPLGWEWTETYTGVNAPRPNQGNANNPLPRDDELRMLPKPKPRRENIRL